MQQIDGEDQFERRAPISFSSHASAHGVSGGFGEASTEVSKHRIDLYILFERFSDNSVAYTVQIAQADGGEERD